MTGENTEVQARREKILIASRDTERCVSLQEWLSDEGYLITVTGDADTAYEEYSPGNYDMLLVDSGLEGMSNYDLIDKIRQLHLSLPVIVIGGVRSEEAARALEHGANDYWAESMGQRELLARLRNLFMLFQERSGSARPIINIGELVINPQSRIVTRSGEVIDLTSREYELLLYLARRVNEVCTREDILKEVWDYDFPTGTNVVDVYILHLREKLDKGRKPKYIRTKRGVGYMLKQTAVSEKSK